jgi:RpiB/LacA/LacB family sugar-phosphate isomerase
LFNLSHPLPQGGGCILNLMNIFVGTDHRGFDLKNKLIEYLQEKNIRIEDLGNYELQPEDDYPDFAQKVAQAILQNPQEFVGIVICGSGVGGSIAANRYHGVRCALAFEPDQARHARENDHANMLALPADYIEFEKAKTIVDSFLAATPKKEDKYLRRIQKVENV